MSPGEVIALIAVALTVLGGGLGVVWRMSRFQVATNSAAAAAAQAAATAATAAAAQAAATANLAEALVSVRLELVELRVELRQLVSGPPQWCHEAMERCREHCPAREPGGA